jgi:hypothetical protein
VQIIVNAGADDENGDPSWNDQNGSISWNQEVNSKASGGQVVVQQWNPVAFQAPPCSKQSCDTSARTGGWKLSGLYDVVYGISDAFAHGNGVYYARIDRYARLENKNVPQYLGALWLCHGVISNGYFATPGDSWDSMKHFTGQKVPYLGRYADQNDQNHCDA